MKQEGGVGVGGRGGSRSSNKTHLDIYAKGKLNVILANF